MQYFDVYIDGMKDLYTYSDKNDEFLLGESVIVPFRNIKKTAIIIKKNESEKYDFKILNIDSKIKDSIRLSSKQLDLIEWLKNYYLLSYDNVIKAMLPKNIKIKSKQNYYVNLEKLNDINLVENEIVEYLLSLTEISYSTAKAKFKKKVVDSLVKEQYLDLAENTIRININKFSLLKEKNMDIYLYFYDKLKIRKENLEKNFSKEKVKNFKDLGILILEVELDEKKNFFKKT